MLIGVVGVLPLHCAALHPGTETRQGMVCSPFLCPPGGKVKVRLGASGVARWFDAAIN